MKKVIVRVIAAAVLLAAGEAVRRAATIEDRLADTDEQLMTQTATVTPASFDEVEAALAFAGRIPILGESLLEDVRERRAVAAYWNGDYPTVTASAPATDEEAGSPTLMFLAANASYRTTLLSRGERAVVLRGLDEALKRYGDVLGAEPDHTGAAYNYEFVSRLRTALGKGRQGEMLATEGPPNMHGEEGDPPPGTQPPDFNVIVPLRPDERQEQFDAGVGGVTRRRG